VRSVYALAAAAMLFVAGSAEAGDASRGRAIVADARGSLCVLCHKAPLSEVLFQGELGPDLAGVGARLSERELRARLVNPRAFNPDTIMPSYARTDGFTRVAANQAGRPLLSEAQIDDVVAYLATLRGTQ
jgi:L-cysteine S-thiosulfotransferase